MGKDIDITDISRLMEWDETSFHWLYREYYKSLVAHAMRLIGDAPCAEDIVEELFVHTYTTPARRSRLSKPFATTFTAACIIVASTTCAITRP